MLIPEIFERLRYWRDADRLGPDVPWTHWRLHFKSTMLNLCKRKFKFFDDTAEFRPYAYAIGCSNIKIGKRGRIRPGTMLFAEAGSERGSITIGDYVLMGAGIHFYVNSHAFADMTKWPHEQGYEKFAPVVIENGAWIGANAILLPGVTIGERAVVGAGSVVTDSIPPRSVAVGSPAKIIKTF